MAASLAIAVPFGAISVLIVETGLRRGRRLAWSAGAGAATADFLYVSLAALFGAALSTVIAPIQTDLRWVSVAILVVIAARGIMLTVRRARASRADPGPARLDGSTARRTYLQFVGLTIVNPTTVIYFAALMVGLPSLGSGAAGKVAFVLGAGLASLAWQLFLGTVGGLLHQRVSARPMAALSLAGYGMVLLIAGSIARGLVAG